MQPEAQETKSLGDVVENLAWRLDPNHDAHRGGFSTGDAAELRRLDPTKGVDASGPTFWRIVVHDLEANGLLGTQEDGERLKAWIAILHGLAHMAGLHRRGRPLGAALAAAEVSEMRLTRLLRTRGDELFDQLRVTLQILSSRGEAIDSVELARFVLSGVGSNGGSEEKREATRRYVARFFYRAEKPRSASKTEKSNETAA